MMLPSEYNQKKKDQLSDINESKNELFSSNQISDDEFQYQKQSIYKSKN
jgi:hypothetical protein